MEHFIAGDPLRGLAAMTVFTTHAAAAAAILTGHGGFLAAYAGTPTGHLETYGLVLGSIAVAGPFGFLVFFVLSGYLIGWPFVRALIDDRPLPSLRSYARNRALRVLPAYWTALTAIVVIFILIAREAELSLADVLALYALQVSPRDPWIAQAWSLGVEVKFYVLLPVVAVVAAPLFRMLSSERARAFAIALPCVALLIAAPFVYADRAPDEALFPFMLRMLVAGVAIAAVAPMVRRHVAGRRAWARAAAVAFAAAAACVLGAGAIYSLGAPFDQPLGNVLFDTAAITLVAAPLVRQWSAGGSWLALDNAATRWFGVSPAGRPTVADARL